MANPEHICTIRQGVDIWNQWRARHPHTFPDLSGADLKGLNLKRADFRDTNLSGADLSNADLSEAELCHANLERVTLRKAELFRTDFFSAVLSGADMSEANLSYAILVEANLDRAKISGCQIYGLSAWNIKEKPSEQANLVISCKDNPTITVNNIEMAQLIFVLYNNKKIRDLIDAVAEEVVLILGRFTEARKNILDGIRGRLALLDYSPILFDFDRPVSRTLTETVSTLAHMARFIIADITEAKSIPQELMAIVPHLPNVPIQPILDKRHDEYGMFESIASYPWVLPVHRYESREELLNGFKVNVIEPVENWLKARNSVATRRITPGEQ